MRLIGLLGLLASTLTASSWVRFEKTVQGGVTLPALDRAGTHVLTASTAGLRQPCPIEITAASRPFLRKVLHPGDADWTVPFRAPSEALRLTTACPVQARITSWPAGAPLEAEPNDTWNQANQIRLGETWFGSGDDAPYFPVPGAGAIALKKAALEQAPDWFRFDFNEPRPKLIYFQLELMERDQVPVDVAVFRVKDGKPTPFNEGEDPVTIPHEVQALQGNKFTTRVLREPGVYYIRVIANHPEYKLRTRVYDVPPYATPEPAVRAALDYLLGAGDSWHANTPRRGGVYDRVSAVHQETSLCVACHVTHFTQRAQLYALRQGYPVVQRQQLQFLAERFYNNPRPLFGFEKEGAVWARMISASANVLGRMSHLLDIYEREVTGQPRAWFRTGVNEYLRIYYDGRDKLPPDETNGNQPLVSAHEVAWYAWESNRDPKLPELIAKGEVKNVIDLCYQTLALATIDKAKYAAKIQANVDRLLALQRPDGQWSARFDAKEKEAEFQTGHALWTLAVAGVPRSDERVAKGLRYLLGRQQEFGGWLDPLQSFENFRTPFRETQMAVLALSHYYPQPKPKATPAGPLSADLRALDDLWTKPADAAALEALAAHDDPFVRQQAVEAMGRLALANATPVLTARLADPSKLVQRTAAWALRRIYSAHAPKPTELAAALDSRNERLRWGATRVFATHFSALTKAPELAAALDRRTRDMSPAIATQAVKGLWQFWFWTPDTPIRERIEDSLLSSLAKPQHPWVEQALREAIYNLPDENIRYLYNNWVPAIARQEDQHKIIRGRLALEARLAEKFSRFLEEQSNPNRKRLLAALVELPLRRADIYQPDVDSSRGFVPVYNRIGNDVEQTVFFGESSSRFARALLKVRAAAAGDTELERLITGAALLTRDARFGVVNTIAGAPGPEREALVAAAKADLQKPENAELLKAFNQYPRPASSGRGAARATGARPDDAFFRGYVEPILARRGKDGQACVHCHSTHSIFNATLSTAMNVVNLEDPEKSLILLKPTWSAETEGTLGAQSHGGGVRFEKDSPEYNTILNWIRGVKE